MSANCACKSSDAWECWARRYRHDDPITGDFVMSYDRVEDEGGPCECYCHYDEDEDDPCHGPDDTTCPVCGIG